MGVAGFYSLSRYEGDSRQQLHYTKTTKDIFEPGSKKAYLLLAGTEVIDLSEPFEISREDGTLISNNRELVSFKNEKPLKKPATQHTLHVPKGGEYELLLSDGSKVYINAESQLSFPSHFNGDTRHVELIGEAFFEVKKDTKPFIVETADIKIEVFGTSFNVNAYRNNPYVNATLVDGSIKVDLVGSPASFTLTPKDNFSLDKLSHKLSIEPVNTDIYTAWIRGEFVFRNQALADIFSQLERWYDFTILYENPAIQSIRFTGSAEKARPLDYLLNQIQSVTDIRYRSEGEQIILY
jgi:ferric-dicitrate binding protein FerR (iron transport regulator)